MLILTATMFPPFCSEVLMGGEVRKGTQLRINPKDHTAPVTTISARRAAPWTVFFAEKSDTATPAIAGFYVESNFINEVHNRKSPKRGS
jgi:hypothetical protein